MLQTHTAARVVACFGLLLSSCASAPPSRFPNASAALDRMRQTYACSRSVRAEAKIDYFESRGRVRGNVMYIAALPEKLRFDVFSPFGVTLATLTSDGKNFGLYDFRARSFHYGPANLCNVARFTRVPVPPHALAQLLRGEAPVLLHSPEQASLDWESGPFSSGRYVVQIRSKHAASERIELAPRPEDWQRPWAEQRVRVLKVAIEQQGIELYTADLADHRVVRTAPAQVDPDGLSPTLPPSGPACDAEVPGRVRLEVPDTDQDLILRNDRVHHNPPLDTGTFRQTPPGGVKLRYSPCGSAP
ncbi:MAG TPA: hypothetical protein VK524_34780 [Polyangiaceae bacterium]|nr:hypothetical protein [Polyangiaceae bacterium]